MSEAHDRAAACLEYLYLVNASFDLMSDEDAKKTDCFQIFYQSDGSNNRDCLEPYKEQFGPQDATQQCGRCKIKGCMGHFGWMDFPMERQEPDSQCDPERVMIFHPGFVNQVRFILRVVCDQCWTIRVDIKDPLVVPRLEKIANAPRALRLAMLLELTGKNNDVRECVRCTHKPNNPDVNLYCAQKAEIYPPTARGEIKAVYTPTNQPKAKQKESKGMPKELISLRPRTVYEGLTKSMPEYDRNLIGRSVNELKGMFKTGVLIPPNRYRPKTNKMRSDDFTLSFKNMMKACIQYETVNVRSNDLEITLFESCAKFIKDWKDLAKQKAGLIRGAMYSKRPFNSARATIIPSARSTHNFGSIGVSKNIADELSRSHLVTSDNIQQLQRLVFAGKALAIEKVSGARSWSPITVTSDNFSDRSNHFLQEGDKVRITITTNDIGVAGRQPVQNMHNIQGVRLDIINSHNVIELDINPTKVLGADYDGDTMFLHILQTLLAIEEANTIMRLDNRLRSAQRGGPVVGLTYNGSLAATLLTADPDLEISRDLFLRCMDVILIPDNSGEDSREFDFNDHFRRMDKYGVPHYSGRSLFSTFLPRDFEYTGSEKSGVLIKEGVMISGVLISDEVEATMGGIVDKMSNAYAPEIAAQFINDASSALSVFLDAYGFTITYMDYAEIADPSYTMSNITADPVGATLVRSLPQLSHDAIVASKVESAKRRLLSLKRGETYYEKMWYEKEYQAIASDLQTMAQASTFTTQQLAENNVLFLSTKSGVKGSIAQASQISVSLGMQLQAGKDLPKTVTGGSRITVMDIPHDIFPKARGFIQHSYLEGLSPQESINASTSGRPAMAATTQPTKIFGRMQRDIQLATANYITVHGGVVSGNRVCVDPCAGGDSKNGEKIISVAGSLQSCVLANKIAQINTKSK